MAISSPELVCGRGREQGVMCHGITFKKLYHYPHTFPTTFPASSARNKQEQLVDLENVTLLLLEFLNVGLGSFNSLALSDKGFDERLVHIGYGPSRSTEVELLTWSYQPKYRGEKGEEMMKRTTPSSSMVAKSSASSFILCWM